MSMIYLKNGSSEALLKAQNCCDLAYNVMSSFFCFRYRLKKLKWGEQISPSIQVVDLKLKLSGSATRHES
jgi:hypothetical protein